ncbi:MAG: quinolinate synthase NadA [Deltaproteobacteria bacterium]|nr:quinolinate synthase NadA [Deltaproteobacteria bacterium]
MSDEKIIARINELKKERNAVILAHNYQRPEVQEIADFSGDSLALSRIAAETDADVVVFCGVHFMAETAYILSPEKTVLMPDADAGCPMADMVSAEQLLELKKDHPKATVLSYVNTSAEVKAETDVCCTSGNALKVLEKLKDKAEIIFVPDKYLGSYIAKTAGKEMILWNGYCPTHVKILEEDITKQKEAHPNALVLVHPECTIPVTEMADQVLSTEQICRFAQESNVQEFIIGTEIGILHRLQKENPDKKFYPATELASCPNMKKTTLEKILWSLEHMQHKVEVPEEIRKKARGAVDRMVEIL